MFWKNLNHVIDEIKLKRKYQIGVALSIAVLGSYGFRKFRKVRYELSPKHAIALTGCDSGLGYSLALHCREKGVKVIAGVLDPDGPGAKDLGSKDIKVVNLDLTDNTSVRNFSVEVKELLDKEKLELRAVVNNAGVMVFGEFEWLLPEQMEQQIEVNILGTMSLTKQLMPLIRRDSSRLVNIASHCALAPLPGLSVYGATKAALLAWSTALRLEFRKFGSSVVTFVPGSFPFESNIFGAQKKYFNDMRANMSDDAKYYYGNYFEEYVSYLSSMPVNEGLRRLQNPKIYEVFDGALLDKHPSAVYKCEPWRYTFYHTLFDVTPMRIRDWLVEKFIKMPSWKSGSQPSSSATKEA